MRNALKNVIARPQRGRNNPRIPWVCFALLTMIIFLISSCGGGDGNTLDAFLQPTFPDRLNSIKANVEAVGTVRSNVDETSEVIAGPAIGVLGSDGAYTFQMTQLASPPESGGFLHVNFNYIPPPVAQVAKDVAQDSILVAKLAVQMQRDGITVQPSDFDTSPDDDADGMVNLDEIALGLDPKDMDTDDDGVADGMDVFPSLSTEWSDMDKDGIGDNSDNDIDGDGLSNSDEALYGTNPLCVDTDNDGITDGIDNCKIVSNANQRDTDGDGRGDECENDTDGDGLSDVDEDRYGTNKLLIDTDGDGLGDLTEVNLGTNPLSIDSDGDSRSDGSDNCPRNVNADQLDSDGDHVGDVCDSDKDNDGVANETDNCDLVRNTDQADEDGDGLGNACDPDIDGDLISNDTDNCPYIYNPGQSATDADADAISIDCDLDDTDINIGAKEDAVFVDIAHGTDTNSGTMDSPLASIAAALIKARSQSKDVYVAAGIYNVANVVWASGDRIFGGFRNDSDPRLRFSSRNVRSGDVAYQTQLRRTTSDVTISTSSITGLVIGGFYIVNAAATFDPVEGARTVEISGGSVTLDRNTIIGNLIATRSTAVRVKSSANVAFTRNLIDGGGRDAAGSTTVGMSFVGASGIVTNNIVKAGNGRFATGMELHSSSPIIVNNTIDARSWNASLGIAEGLVFNSSSPVVVNNLIFTGNAPDQYILQCEGSAPSSTSMFKNNLLAVFPQSDVNPLARDCDGVTYGTAAFTMGAAEVSGNLAYTASDIVSNLIDANYRPVGGGGNDCVDDGLDSSGAQFGTVTADYNGTARPRGAAYDIGAVER